LFQAAEELDEEMTKEKTPLAAETADGLDAEVAGQKADEEEAVHGEEVEEGEEDREIVEARDELGLLAEEEDEEEEERTLELGEPGYDVVSTGTGTDSDPIVFKDNFSGTRV
jgi:hypothetical protein